MKVIKQSHIASIAAMNMRGVDDFDACIAADSQRLGELGDNVTSRRRFHSCAGSNKVVLHIDHNHRGLLWINNVNMHGFLPPARRPSVREPYRRPIIAAQDTRKEE
jgi:hypothetical protein